MTANTLDGHEKSIEDIALEVIAGKWGTGDELRKNLAAAGYSHMEVVAAVSLLKQRPPGCG